MKDLKENPVIKAIWTKYGYNIFIFLGLIGIFLISADNIFVKKEPVENIKNAASDELYRKELEVQLTEILSQVNGAGDVQIMITLESGEENIYVRQEKTTDDIQTVSADVSLHTTERSTYENEIVLVNDGSYRTALVEKTMRPAVQGVVVVCQGADNIQVVSNITNAVCVVLNVPSNRVCVIKMK